MPDEVGRFQVGFVAGRRPPGERDPVLLGLVDGPALVSALGDQRDALAGEVLAERLEAVQRRVGSEHVHVAGRDELFQFRLARATVLPGLGEARGKDHDIRDPRFDRVAQRVGSVRRDHDRDVDVVGDVGQRRIALLAIDGLAVGVDRDHATTELVGPAFDHAPVERALAGGGVRRADHRDDLGAEQPLEIDVAKRDGTAGDVGLHGTPGVVAEI